MTFSDIIPESDQYEVAKAKLGLNVYFSNHLGDLGWALLKWTINKRREEH